MPLASRPALTPTSVMTMTEMPHGRQIRGSAKNFDARSSPSKLDCRQQAHESTLHAMQL